MNKLINNLVLLIAIILFMINGVSHPLAFPLSLALMSVVIVIFFATGKLNFSIFNNWKCFLVSTHYLWLVFALVFGLYAYNIYMHYKFTFIVIYLSIASLIIAYYLTKDIGLLIKFTLYTSVLFVSINILLFVFYKSGVVNYKANEFSGIYINRNSLSVNAVLLMPLLIFIKDYVRSNTNLLINICLIFMLFLIFMTGSVKGVLGAIIVLSISFVLKFKFIKFVKMLSFAVLCVGLLFLFDVHKTSSISPIFNHTISRVESHLSVLDPNSTVKQNFSTIERIWLTEKSLSIIGRNTFTGIGVHNSQFFLISPYRPTNGNCGFKCGGVYSHNNYLEMLLNGGVFTFSLYYLPCLLILSICVIRFISDKKYRPIYLLIISTLCYKLFHDIAMVSYLIYQNVFMLNLMFLVFIRTNKTKAKVNYEN